MPHRSRLLVPLRHRNVVSPNCVGETRKGRSSWGGVLRSLSSAAGVPFVSGLLTCLAVRCCHNERGPRGLQSESYPARLNIDYPEKLDRVTTFFRLIWAIPIVIILSLLSATATSTVTVVTDAGETAVSY